VNPTYHRPTTLAQAVQLKAELGPGAVFLAGGTEVNNRRHARPEALIDLAGLGLDKFEFLPGGIRIGAGITFQRIVEHPDVPWYLKAAARQMANRNIRNRATIGGQLGNNRSCADLIPTLLAAQAVVSLADRELPIEQFIDGQQGLILSVFLPVTDRGFGLNHTTRTASDVSLVAASASLTVDAGQIRNPILAVGGVARTVVRLHCVEKQLEGQPLPSAEFIEKIIAEEVHPIDDLRGSATYKRHIAAVLGQRALRDAVNHVLSTEGGR